MCCCCCCCCCCCSIPTLFHKYHMYKHTHALLIPLYPHTTTTFQIIMLIFILLIITVIRIIIISMTITITTTIIITTQAAKLHVFCTRPSINAPVWNFVCEFMSTTLLVLIVNMIRMRRAGILQSALSLWPTQVVCGYLNAMWVVCSCGGWSGVEL